MVRKKSIYFLFYLILIGSNKTNADVHIDEWDYDHHHTHQENWDGVCKTGRKQSPINIQTNQTNKRTWTEPFVFIGYDQKISVLVKNNRHTIVATPTKEWPTKAFVLGGGLGKSKFQFAQAHFHWGSTNDKGSEHTIDEKSAPMEMHLVHWNVDVDPVLKKAVEKGAKNSLEVLGVHFKIGQENERFGAIFNSIKHVVKENKTTTIRKGIKLKDLLPDDKLQYYRYQGSLTTPSCNEIVVWTIFKQPIEISQGQLDELRKVYYHRTGEVEERYISNNYRLPQPLYERKVQEITTEVKFETHGNGGVSCVQNGNGNGNGDPGVPEVKFETHGNGGVSVNHPSGNIFIKFAFVFIIAKQICNL